MRLCPSPPWRRCLEACGLLWLAALVVGQGIGAESVSTPPPVVVTNILALRRLASADPSASHGFEIEADVWWANRSQGRLVLHDASGTEEFAMDLSGQPVKAGDRVRLTGKGILVRRGTACRLGTTGPVIENDGVHSLLEQSGSVYLTAGWHPFRLDWFNGTEQELYLYGGGVPPLTPDEKIDILWREAGLRGWNLEPATVSREG